MLWGPVRPHSPSAAGSGVPASAGSPCAAAAPALLEPAAVPGAVPGAAAASAPAAAALPALSPVQPWGAGRGLQGVALWEPAR